MVKILNGNLSKSGTSGLVSDFSGFWQCSTYLFFTFWNNLIWGGLVLGREIENVTSLQFSSSPFMAGEERGGADKEGWVGDKWELQDPSLLPSLVGISTFRRGEGPC